MLLDAGAAAGWSIAHDAVRRASGSTGGWADVIANYTVPTAVLAAIPLDGLPTEAGQAVRSHDGVDPRIFRWDGEQHQWRHVPDLATFQTLGLYCCDVAAANPDFYDRLPDALLGPPYPASAEPAQADYPVCRTA